MDEPSHEKFVDSTSTPLALQTICETIDVDMTHHAKTAGRTLD